MQCNIHVIYSGRNRFKDDSVVADTGFVLNSGLAADGVGEAGSDSTSAAAAVVPGLVADTGVVRLVHVSSEASALTSPLSAIAGCVAVVTVPGPLCFDGGLTESDAAAVDSFIATQVQYGSSGLRHVIGDLQ